jgi:hypothetical protein
VRAHPLQFVILASRRNLVLDATKCVTSAPLAAARSPDAHFRHSAGVKKDWIEALRTVVQYDERLKQLETQLLNAVRAGRCAERQA